MKIFIAGTDTGVGKTFVSIGLAKSLPDSIVYKPVASGSLSFNRQRVSEDALLIKESIAPDEDISIINPILFEKPMAPFMELLINKKKHLKKSKIQRQIFEGFKKISQKYNNVIVEGIGGVLVPILEDYFCIDIANDLNLPVVIVARPYLGTINHTALTIESCRSRKIKIIGIIICYHSAFFYRGDVEKWSPRVIARCFDVKILGIVPHLRSQNYRYRKVFSKIVERINYVLCDKRL